METLNIKDSLSKVKIYGRYLSEFLLPDQVDILEKSLQKDIEDGSLNYPMTNPVIEQRELLEGFVDWFNTNDKTQAILSERIEEYLKTL